MNIPQLVSTLEETPGWVRSGLTGVSDADARRPPRPGEWCLADILAHLRAADSILAPRVFHVLVRDQPPLIGFDERAWAVLASTARLPLVTQLDIFAGARSELVGVLRALDTQAWSRTGTHETRGRMTLVQIVGDIAEHETEHRGQWNAVLAALGSDPPRPPRRPRPAS